jgi:signal transduction histidine kinase
MDSKIEKTINIVLYITVIFTFAFSISLNKEDTAVLGLLSSLLIVSISMRHVFVYTSPKLRSLAKLLFIIDTVLVYFIVHFDNSGIPQLYLLALIGEAVVYNNTYYSFFITSASYLTYISSSYIRDAYPPILSFIPFAVVSLASFLFVYAGLCLTKKQINQRLHLVNALKEIRIQNSQLEKAYEKLQQNSQIAEEVAVLKERNRIAHEIHDTVGHTLTTVLVELEAGKRLITRKPDLAVEKLDLAQEQVRKGLSDIRKSVKMLQDRGSIMEFLPSILSLIKETEKHADIKIKYDIPSNADLKPEYEKLIYSALMEGITNGIKHGKSSEFFLRLTIKNDYVDFHLEDNGIGCDSIIPGFGLTSMKKRVVGLRGYFKIISASGKGCSISFSLPL